MAGDTLDPGNALRTYVTYRSRIALRSLTTESTVYTGRANITLRALYCGIISIMTSRPAWARKCGGQSRNSNMTFRPPWTNCTNRPYMSWNPLNSSRALNTFRATMSGFALNVS